MPSASKYSGSSLYCLTWGHLCLYVCAIGLLGTTVSTRETAAPRFSGQCCCTGAKLAGFIEPKELELRINAASASGASLPPGLPGQRWSMVAVKPVRGRARSFGNEPWRVTRLRLKTRRPYATWPSLLRLALAGTAGRQLALTTLGVPGVEVYPRQRSIHCMVKCETFDMMQTWSKYMRFVISSLHSTRRHSLGKIDTNGAQD